MPEIEGFTAQMMMSYRVSTLDRGAVHENRSQSEGAFVRSRLRGIGEAEGNLRRPQGEGRTAETPKKTAIYSNCGQRCQGRYDQRTCRVRDLRVAGWVVYLEFERWKQSLRWQRLGPYRKFADMIERHWDGIAAYCRPENKVSLGMVEGLNNKIRVIQRSAYGYRDEEYLRLKVIASFLPPLPENARLHPH